MELKEGQVYVNPEGDKIIILQVSNGWVTYSNLHISNKWRVPHLLTSLEYFSYTLDRHSMFQNILKELYGD